MGDCKDCMFVNLCLPLERDMNFNDDDICENYWSFLEFYKNDNRFWAEEDFENYWGEMSYHLMEGTILDTEEDEYTDYIW